MRLQVAEDGTGAVARDFFRHLETEVVSARSYRGKVLSLEQGEMYSGAASGVKVHRLGRVAREEVVLSKKTLELLDRNVIDFVRRREQLGAYRMATKKGILFYGPPGTGKTHTIRYLASSLPGHTTLLISAEQVSLLGEYMTLARLLQPSIVVIEDVDLIARDRARMAGASEVLLNKLLNEMDGLREDCEILFILTTNRPEELEAALASRPGRIDQAIEFPLPDTEGREKLVRLYSQGIEVPGDVVDQIVKRTDRVSASFIKELMRRAAQFHLERNGTRTISLADVENALDEMLFSGGSLNLKLLGAEQRIGDE
jgi:ATP-dependent 26S proteasome regulatory subunit